MSPSEDEPTTAEPKMRTGLVALLVVLGLVMLGGVPAGLWTLKLRRDEMVRQHMEKALEAQRTAREHAERAAQDAARRAQEAEQQARQAQKE